MQPAWVLGRQSYRDSSYLVHFLTASDGRLSAVVKGAHRKQRGGMMAALMQPFQPLLVKFGGQQRVKIRSGSGKRWYQPHAGRRNIVLRALPQ